MKSCEVFAPAWGAPEEVPTENINLKWLRVYYIQGDDRNNNSIFTKILQKEEEGAEKFQHLLFFLHYTKLLNLGNILQFLSCVRG